MRRIGLIVGVGLWAFCAFGGRAASVGDYTEEVREKVVRRIADALSGVDAEVSGVVTYADEDSFFLQSEGEGLKVVVPKGGLPRTGEAVVVSGAPSLEGGRVILLARTWNATGPAKRPEARFVTPNEMMEDAGRGSANWVVARVKGSVVGRLESGLVIRADDMPINVHMKTIPSEMADYETTRPDVSVQGVLELMLDQSALMGRQRVVIGVKLYVNGPEDITVEPNAGYLMRKHDLKVRRAGLWILGGLTALMLIFGLVIFRQRRRLFQSRTVMAERKRMADDIHDTIEQHLVGAKMLLGLGRIHEAQDVLVRAKREIRDIVWGLKNDDMMRLKPADMLRQLAHDENTKGIYRVDTKLDAGLPETLDAASMRDLCLIVREAIGNAVKHGGARKIALSSDALGSHGWRLRLSNDGKPFDPETAPGAAEGHFGLEGMRQRARRIGAALSFVRRKEGMVLALEKHT